MTDTKQPKNWRRMLADLGGYENGLINIPAAGVIPIIDEVEQLRAKLDELAKQEHAAFVNEQGFIVERDDMQISSGEKLYLAAGARPVVEEPAAEPIDEYQRGRRAGITEFYDSLYALDKDRALAALHKIEPQPAPAAQDDAKDAARWRYAVEIGGNQRMNWLDVYDDWDGDGSFADAIDAAMAADIFGDAPQPSQEPPPLKPMCCRCLDESDDLFPANCSEKPELLTGAPLGMYHCPDCGAMVCAGFPHGPLCQTCHDRKHPGFDCDHTSAADKKEPT